MKFIHMRRYFLLFILAICMLTSCRKSQPSYKIGVAQCSSDQWRSMMNEEIQREMLFHDDAQVEIRSAGDDNASQIADIQYFIDNKFDIIITAPNEAEAITPVIRKAYESGIPVIIFDRAINDDCYTSYIELDNEGIGRSAAQYARHILNGTNGHILEIRGLDGSTPAAERHKGFATTISADPMSTIDVSVSGAWNGEKAQQITDSVLRLHPGINLIYAHNDVMAIGASKAAQALGLRKDVKILGTDAVPALGIKAVADTIIDASFIYPTEGQRVISTALAILKGENYPRHDHIPSLSSVDLTNAEILLRQNELLRDETNKIEILKKSNDIIKSQHEAQSMFLYAIVVGVILLIVAMVLLIKVMRQRQRYHKTVAEKNLELEAERDKQDELYRQLDEATHSKLVFFTNVSHDLRTPLTLLAEPVEQVAAADYLTPPHKVLMQIALNNVKILRRLIDQILDFRRYQNGKTELMLQEADFLGLIREWTQSFEAAAAKRHIHLNIATEGESNFTVALDIEKLERVFFNILSNAFKYTPDNGKIDVKATADESRVSFSVTDSGMGMSEEESRQVFDRFYQADRIHPRGSGIGLSLSKAFVELMGGIISVNSKPGEGSVFMVTIPVSHTANAAMLPAVINKEATFEITTIEENPRECDSTKPLMLVIDDNPDIRRLIMEILGNDYNILTANDGKAGFRTALKYVPDIIICDIMMPVMDGLECCRLLKEEITTSHIPVLMLTACKLDEQRLQSYDSGADAYISKPFSSNILSVRCKNLLLNRIRIKNVLAADSAERIKNPEARNLPETLDPLQVESEFYADFLKIVEEEFIRPELSLKDIAGRLNIGPAQLARKIKALTNYSPVDIIRNYRLRRARHLIRTTQRPISEIAYEVGFSSPPYFTKCYREAFGHTPSTDR